MLDINQRIDIKTLKQILSKFNGKKIVVLGDLMLDHYLIGHVERISPEAPVPIVDIKKQEYKLGGAANVVNNIASLKATPIVIGLIGKDDYSTRLLSIFKENGINAEYIVKDSSRSTTVKTRVFSAGQQIMRFDFEERHDISAEIEENILQQLDSVIPNADAVIIEDYNKGLLTPNVISHTLALANKHNKPITVDPKFKNFLAYKNSTVFKPNFNELQKFLNHEITNDDEMKQTAQKLLHEINPEYLVLTLGERGLKIFDKNENTHHIPTFAKEVFDVSGAGDTVISVLTLCLSAGLDIKSSAFIANHAAGAVCGMRGIHPATVDDIVLSVKYFNMMKENNLS